ncbi:hypothetical protein [Vulgatibacter sp.]|uniref:hypothetical protein n=1 Tax=Vulgatibacter sp. TaxID=1971226 RepID=UPI003561D438
MRSASVFLAALLVAACGGSGSENNDGGSGGGSAGAGGRGGSGGAGGNGGAGGSGGGQGGCAEDIECPVGTYCLGGACAETECDGDDDCSAGAFCAQGFCLPEGETCTSTADCYDGAGYCGNFGDPESICVSTACGSKFNVCSRCELGPDAGAGEADGPILFYAAPEGSCGARAGCPTATPIGCSFSVIAWDPQGDLPDAQQVEGKLQAIGADGGLSPVLGPTANFVAGMVQYGFDLCFAESASGRYGSAVVLADLGGHHSQSACLDAP